MIMIKYNLFKILFVCIFSSAKSEGLSPSRTLELTTIDVLSLLYNSTGGNSAWRNNTNWLIGNPCPSGSWYGVTCSGGSDVIILDISANNAHGNLPSQIGLLSKLTSLRIHENEFQGSLPSEIGQLTNMISKFFIYSNSFTGSFPSQVGQLTLLETNFEPQQNSFSGAVPSQLGQLTALTRYFYLFSNQFTGSFPSQIGLITELNYGFNQVSNHFTSSLPSELGQLTKMGSYFYLFSNSFNGSLPSELGQLSLMIGLLHLQSNQFSGSLPTELGQLSLMTSGLKLGINSFQGSIPSQFGFWNKFKDVFYLFSNQFSGSVPSQLGLMTSMTSSFNIYSNQLTGSIPSQLGSMTLLQTYFQIYENNFNGSVPSQLGQLTKMSLFFQLEANMLSGSIPSELGRLSLMRAEFNLDDNSFTGYLPAQLGQLSLMTYSFVVSRNCLNGSLPSEIGQLTGMKSTVYMYSNSFIGRLPSQIGMMTSLTRNIFVSTNSFSSSLPSELGQLTSLSTYFYFSSNEFNGTLPSQLGRMSKMISYFNVDTNSFSSFIPSELGQLSLLENEFNLFSNHFTGSIPTELGQLTMMTTSFRLKMNILCGEIPSQVSRLSSSVTASWELITGNSLGTLCCLVSPSMFSCSPTPSPSGLPSMTPTSVTSPPSILPSPLPSDSPTLVPTSLPSPIPTLAPTVFCDSGTYISTDGLLCIDCAIGYYSTVDQAPFATSCSLCPSGRYNIESGSSSCLECATGKLSSPDRTFCLDCEAGQYNHNNTECVNCEYGKYAPQALTGSCLECGTGFHTNNATKATTCTSCDAGSYSNSSTVLCSNCLVGRYSSSGSSRCILCAAGSIASSEGLSSCSSCSSGTFASQTGSIACISCPEGKYQGSTGQSGCDSCDAGKYSDTASSSTCTSCDIGRWSETSSKSCELAADKYYLRFDGLSFECPNHANCQGGNSVPVPDEGYWVDHSHYKFADVIYKCARDTCVKKLQNSTCWDISEFSNGSSSCDFDELQCKKGAWGPYCGSCLDGYVYQGISNACEECSNVQIGSYVVLGTVMMIALISVVYFQLGDSLNIKQSRPVRYLSNLETGSLKVLWVSYQIIESSSFTLGIQFPPPFNSMLGYFSIFSLDLLALECLNHGADAYFITVYLWCVFPILISSLILLIGLARILKSSFIIDTMDDVQQNKDDQMKAIINQHIWFFLFLSYIVLPTVSNKQLQAFDCIELKSGNRYLRSDTAINCDSGDYLNFQAIVIVFISIYQLIPVCWITLLYRNREDLNPHTSNHDENLAMFIRDNNPSLMPLRFLFIDYKCNKWWFEIADMYRRIIFIGIVPLVSPNPATRASFGCLLAILSVAYFREEQPYRVEFTNVIAHIAQFSILVTFYCALTLETSSMINFGLEGTKLGVFLLIANLVILMLAFWFAYSCFQRELNRQALKEFKATNTEDARSFSKVKFNTTFEAIWRHSVPSSHTLAFHYCDTELAAQALKAGIAAQKQFNGIALTLRQPYALIDSDFNVFVLQNDDDPTENEARQATKKFPAECVLVLTLPRQFLDPLPGYEEDDGLCMISSQVLNALRPTSFTAVVDSRAWLDGFVLLPPQCILRCFKLTDHNHCQQTLQHHSSVSSISSYSVDRQSLINIDSALKDPYPTSDLVKSVTPLVSISEFIRQMSVIRQKARELNLIPLFHYTSPSVTPLILKSGLRMSSQGQGDGGVYVSTLGPASYGLGTDDYEINIIKDCFGVERVDEYEGQGKLDVIIVYGCGAAAMQQAPGSRDNAKMISKSTFQWFSLEHADGNYFLRPDRILGCFLVDHNKLPIIKLKSQSELEFEKNRDQQSIEKIELIEKKHRSNVRRIDNAVASIWRSLSEVRVSDSVDDDDEVVIDIRRSSATSMASSPVCQPVDGDDIEMSNFELNENDDGGHQENRESFDSFTAHENPMMSKVTSNFI